MERDGERFRHAFEAVNVGKSITTLDGEIDVNKAFCDMLGYTGEELRGRKWQEFTLPEEIKEVQRRLESLLAGSADSVRFDKRYIRKDDTIIWADVNVTLIRDGDGNPLYFVTTAVDITSRKEAEAEVRRSEAFVRTIMDNLPIGVAVNSVDPSVKFEYVNDNFTKFYRTTREAITGEDAFWNAVYQDKTFRDIIRKRVLDDTASDDPARMRWEEIPIVRDGESTTFISAANIPVPDKQLVISTVWDVTKRKMAEEALRESDMRYRMIFETSLDAVFLTSPDGSTVSVNPAGCRMFRRSEEEIRAFGKAILFDPDDPRLKAALEERERSGRFSKELTGVRSDGTRFPVEVSSMVFTDRSGRLWTSTIMRDISERKEVEASRARLLRILESSLNEVYVIDTATLAFEYVNTGALNNLGYTIDEMRRMTPVDLKPEFTEETFRRIVEPLLNNEEQGLIFETVHRRADGSTYPVEVHLQLVRLEDQQVFLAVILDITDRKRSQDRLKESERRLREAGEMAQLGYWQWDVKTGAVEWSEEVYRIFHLDPHTFVPHIDSILAFSPWPEERRRGEELIKAAVESREKGEYEQKILRPDGTIGYYHSTFQGHYDEEGNLVTIVGSAMDITNRKRAEAELREKEVQYRNLANTGLALIWTAGTDKLCNYFNEPWLRFTGRTIEQEMGNGWTEGVHPDDVDRCFRVYDTSFDKREPFDMEYRLRHKSGEYRWIRDMGTPNFDSTGEFIGYIGHCFDVTAQRKAEEEIRTLNAQLEQRVRERTVQLEEANRELEAFAYSVSHDLRAPLRAVDGYSRILLEDYKSSLDDEGKRVCDALSKGARTMGRLIDDLLAFSRVGRVEMRSVVVDMTALVRSIYMELTTTEDRERIDFNLSSLPTAPGDPGLIKQIWVNLLGNALKFSSRKVRAVITVEGEKKEGETVYTIRDNGAGFDMAYVNKLFGVFQWLHSTREFDGTGVGLAIVQRIVQRHGGRVWAEGEKEKGGGLSFYVERNLIFLIIPYLQRISLFFHLTRCGFFPIMSIKEVAMALMEWSEQYSVGIPGIDKQHKKLIQIINELHEAMRNRRGKDVLEGLLVELVDYTGYHFDAEERYFQQHQYSGYVNHKTEHDLLKAKVVDFKGKFERGDAMVTLEVMNFLKDWLADHIMVTDKKYGPFLKSKGVA